MSLAISDQAMKLEDRLATSTDLNDNSKRPHAVGCSAFGLFADLETGELSWCKGQLSGEDTVETTFEAACEDGMLSLC